MKKLLQTLKPSFLLFALLITVLAIKPVSGVAQTAGDIAFTGFNGDGDDDFAIVALNDIPANSTIYFTDSEWNGTAFESGEDDITWTTGASVISAGTVVTFDDINSANENVTVGSISAGNMSLGVSNEAIFAYLGTGERAPTTFLAAVSTSIDQYDGTSPDPSGTLDGTGLTQGKEAILLSDNIDVAQYVGDRSGNTKNGYLSLLNDVTNETATDDNWDQTGGTGDQSSQILPFNTQSFVIVNPPTLRFTVSADTVAEDGGTIDLTVELAESSSDAVDVDVAFLSGSSTAKVSDIDNYTTQTVSFLASASSGDTKVVTVNITNPSTPDFEGNENAVFQLQNPSPGTVINPEILNLTIIDDDIPVVINEFLADPATGAAGDANGDGTSSPDDDEFIEIVNKSSIDVDISGWQLSNDGTASGNTHTFPSGTVLPANGAAVVFGGGNPTGNFGGAIVQTTTSLGLTNGSGNVTLLDDQDNVIQDITYGSEAGNDKSITRDPDITGSFVRHASASGSGGSPFSPGTKVDGTAFGSTYAIGLRGSEGYRFVATPTSGTSFDDLFSNLWTQGATGSDGPTAGPNIYGWNETGGGTFAAVTDMSATVTPGQGYIIYVYEDDDFRAPGVQGGFPKVINTNKTENGSTVSVEVSSQDGNSNATFDAGTNEGYNLLGNPYGTDISVTALLDALETANSNVGATDPPNMNRNIAVWDHDMGGSNGGYEYLTDGDQLAPFQAFFMRYTVLFSSSNATFKRSDLAANQGKEFYGQPTEKEPIVRFEMDMGDGQKFDSYNVEFRKKGTIGEDRYDAYKLFSLNPNAISFFSTVGDGVKLAKNVLPSLEELDGEGEIKVPLNYDIPTSGTYTFSWSDLKDLPNDLELFMLDNQTGEKINLKTQEQFQVNLGQGSEQTEQQVENNKRLNPVLGSKNSATDEDSPRFELLVTYDTSQQVPKKDPITQLIVISPNYPNPFNTQTTMDVEVREKMRVKMTIYNIVGQQVASMADKVMNPGQKYPVTWNAPANMPSGIYICKVEAGNMVLTRKMTLVK